MSCNKALNIKNVPMNATWEMEEQFCLSFKDLTPAALSGRYIGIYNATTLYKIWFDVNNASTEPVLAGSTGISVEVATNATPAQIATAFKTAVDAVLAFDYTVSILDSTTVKGVYDSTAKINEPVPGTAGNLVELTRVAIGGSIDLGLLDGDVTFDPSVEVQDITAHQTGAIILGQNITGLGGTVSLTLKEYKPSRYREIYEAVGGKAAGASVYGMGSGMVGKNLLLFAKRLVLKPVGATDDTTNYTFWKAVPDLGSHTFSGENPVTLPLEFTSYIDDSKDVNVNVWAYGDVSTLP